MKKMSIGKTFWATLFLTPLLLITGGIPAFAQVFPFPPRLRFYSRPIVDSQARCMAGVDIYFRPYNSTYIYLRLQDFADAQCYIKGQTPPPQYTNPREYYVRITDIDQRCGVVIYKGLGKNARNVMSTIELRDQRRANPTQQNCEYARETGIKIIELSTVNKVEKALYLPVQSR
jgi:hypothetical protein